MENQTFKVILLVVAVCCVVLYGAAYSFDMDVLVKVSGAVGLISFLLLILSSTNGRRLVVKNQALPQITGVIGVVMTVAILGLSYWLKTEGSALWYNFFCFSIANGLSIIPMMTLFWLTTDPEEMKPPAK